MLIQVTKHDEGKGVRLDPLWEAKETSCHKKHQAVIANYTNPTKGSVDPGRTRVLGERHLSSRNGIHLDYVVAVKFRVSVAPIQQGGTHPVGITFHSLHLPGERGEVYRGKTEKCTTHIA